jgi:membrane-associated phospholipid phosphatase
MHRSSISLLFVLVLLGGQSAPLRAQQSNGDIIKDDFHAAVEDAGNIVTAPLHFSGRDWLIVGAAAAATGSAMLFDEQLREATGDYRETAASGWLQVGYWYGGGLTSAVVGGGMYVGGLSYDDEWTRVTGRLVLESFLYTGAITGLMKIFLGRSRPYMNEGSTSFHFFRLSDAYNSMHSGHSAVAFALSTTLALRINNGWATAALYSLAVLTVVQRICADRHWLSDTILGSSIGAAVGYGVVQFEKSRQVEKAASTNGAGAQGSIPVFFFSTRF